MNVDEDVNVNNQVATTNVNELIILDEDVEEDVMMIIDDDTEIDRLYQIAAPNINEMIALIETREQELDNFTIDYFIETLVRNQFPSYNMQPVAYVQQQHRYRVAPDNIDDIQILLCDHHYVVSHHIARENTVTIYDSLRSNTISTNLRNLLTLIYPGKSRIDTATSQPDTVSCGVFAIANVTTLLFGYKPSRYTLRMDFNEIDTTMMLRSHLGHIFRNEYIVLFPN